MSTERRDPSTIPTDEVEILATNIVPDPKHEAFLFSTCLWVDKVVPNETREALGGLLVVADDARGILFKQKEE
jgi:hypothetical protein